jgi:hypothetical protein
MNGTERAKVPVPLSEASSSAPARACKTAGCEAELSLNNKTGHCKLHSVRDRTRTYPAIADGTRRSVVHSEANGRAKDQDQSSIADRVNLVLMGMPVEVKMKMISGWLAGHL